VISNSTISQNAGKGLNAVASGEQNVLELVHDVIASNGTAGVQAVDAGAAVPVNNTVYDSNSIVGPSGSGFTGLAAQQ
jgi:hypothetical protein